MHDVVSLHYIYNSGRARACSLDMPITTMRGANNILEYSLCAVTMAERKL